MAPLVCFRFDVDSHRCLGEGVPALLDLADRLGVAFTFAVLMGRATHRGRALARPRRGDEPAPRLPSRTKLGWGGLARLALTNPLVGAARPEAVAEIARRGHEVALHGGRNHRVWQEDGSGWDEARVHEEITWALARLRAAGVHGPAGFTSPGWAGSPVIDRTAASLGFRYVADLHEPDREGVTRSAEPALARVVTNVLGEPGGVGYLEWLRAQGTSDHEIVADFRGRLGRATRLAVVYDHPFWAGSNDLAMTGALVEAALELGCEVATVAEAVRREF